MNCIFTLDGEKLIQYVLYMSETLLDEKNTLIILSVGLSEVKILEDEPFIEDQCGEIASIEK